MHSSVSCSGLQICSRTRSLQVLLYTLYVQVRRSLCRVCRGKHALTRGSIRSSLRELGICSLTVLNQMRCPTSFLSSEGAIARSVVPHPLVNYGHHTAGSHARRTVTVPQDWRTPFGFRSSGISFHVPDTCDCDRHLHRSGKYNDASESEIRIQ
jgi:hypothetical protein